MFFSSSSNQFARKPTSSTTASRGRGRPRKESKAVEEDKDKDVPKRGRGRPRKDSNAVEEDKDKDVPKRGRGRPRKDSKAVEEGKENRKTKTLGRLKYQDIDLRNDIHRAIKEEVRNSKPTKRSIELLNNLMKDLILKILMKPRMRTIY